MKVVMILFLKILVFKLILIGNWVLWEEMDEEKLYF